MNSRLYWGGGDNMTNTTESRHNQALRLMTKQRVASRVQMEFELLPNDRVLLKKVYDMPGATQIRIPSFVTDYTPKNENGVPVGAFDGTEYSYIEIDNDPTIDISLEKACSGIQSKRLEVAIKHPERVIQAQGMFFNQRCNRIELINFKLTRCKSMNSMFNLCGNLTELKLNGMITTSVTNFGFMFEGCRNISLLDLQCFDTRKATTLRGMFRYCMKLRHLNLASFKTNKVRTFRDMFQNCESLQSLDVSKFDTRNGISFEGMFAMCKRLEHIDTSGFQTPKAENMSRMFDYCHNLKSINCKGFNTEKVEDFTSMFSDCVSLKRLDIQNFSSASVDRTIFMFRDCVNLEYLDIRNFSVKNIQESKFKESMFDGCPKLNIVQNDAELNRMLHEQTKVAPTGLFNN